MDFFFLLLLPTVKDWIFVFVLVCFLCFCFWLPYNYTFNSVTLSLFMI